MNGKAFLTTLHAAFPGALEKLTKTRGWNREGDRLTAIDLDALADAAGCPDLSGDMVRHFRQSHDLIRKAVAPAILPAPPAAPAPELPLSSPGGGSEVADKLQRMMDGLFGRLDAIGEKIEGLGERVGALERERPGAVLTIVPPEEEEVKRAS